MNSAGKNKQTQDEIKETLKKFDQKAKAKLEKRLASGGMDSDKKDKPKDGKDGSKKGKGGNANENELLKKRDIKAYRKEARRLKKEAKAKDRQKKIASGELVEPEPVDPLVKQERKKKKIEALRSKKKTPNGGQATSIKTVSELQKSMQDFNDIGKEEKEMKQKERIADFINSRVMAQVHNVKKDMPDALKDFIASLQEEDNKQLVTLENIQLHDSFCGVQADDTEAVRTNRILSLVKEEVTLLSHASNQGTKRYNIPAVLVMTANTLKVVEINRLLVKHYSHGGAGEDETAQCDVKVHKLFARHIKPQEQADALILKHPNAKERRVLNVYVGTPGRLAKLAEMQAIKLDKSDRFRLIIADGSPDKKGMTMFELFETQHDTAQLLMQAQDNWKRPPSESEQNDRILKICLIN